jgi:hypothetical protein
MKMTKAGKYIEDQVLSSRCLKPWNNAAAVHKYSTGDGYDALCQLQGIAETIDKHMFSGMWNGLGSGRVEVTDLLDGWSLLTFYCLEVGVSK